MAAQFNLTELGSKVRLPGVDDWDVIQHELKDAVDFGEQEHRTYRAHADGKVRSAMMVMRLGLHLVCAGKTLRATCLWAAAANLCTISHQGLNQRLRRCQLFFAAVLSHLLVSATRVRSTLLCPSYKHIMVADGTCVTLGQGSDSSTHRLHCAMELGQMRLTQMHYDSENPRAGETFKHFDIKANSLWMGDRLYMSASGIEYVLEAENSDVLGRYRRNGLKLYSRRQLDEVMSHQQMLKHFEKYASQDGQRGELHLFMRTSGGTSRSMRLMFKRFTPPQQQRELENLAKSKVELTPFVKRWSHYLVLLSTASQEKLPLEQAFVVTRMRWQIELLFKRFKSIAKLGKGTCLKSESFVARLYLTLIAIVLIEKLAHSVPLDSHYELFEVTELGQLSPIITHPWHTFTFTYTLLSHSIITIHLRDFAQAFRRFCAHLRRQRRTGKRRQPTLQRLLDLFYDLQGLHHEG